MNVIAPIKKPIEAEIRLFTTAFAQFLSTDSPMLEGVNEYVLQKSGNQLRSLVLLLSAKLIGSIAPSTIAAAVSLELLNTASLIHDDVIDEERDRTDKQAASARWTNKIAILSGDYILSKALLSATQTNDIKLIKSIAAIGMHISDGELLQLRNTRITVSSEVEYFNIIYKKTAFLFATCAEIGGLSVMATENKLKHLVQFGTYFGICYQLGIDLLDFADYLELQENAAEIKPKIYVTLPIIYSVLNTTGNEHEIIQQWIENADFSAHNMRAIAQFAHKNGGVQYAHSQLEAYKNKAIEELNGFADDDVKQALLLCIRQTGCVRF